MLVDLLLVAIYIRLVSKPLFLSGFCIVYFLISTMPHGRVEAEQEDKRKRVYADPYEARFAAIESQL